MSIIQNGNTLGEIPRPIHAATRAHSPSSAPTATLSGRIVFFLAMAAGCAVAALYYSQPMLSVLVTKLNASARVAGFVPTMTQLGYTLGIALSPLGERYDRRKVIVVKALALAAALLLAAAAPSIELMLGASLVIGMTATLAQDIVPVEATLAPGAHRSRGVGTIMTGMLLGMLFARVVSGFAAEHSQPMLSVLATGVNSSARAAGFVPIMMQLGYALGIAVLLPLGERYDRRKVIVVKALALAAALLLAATAPSIELMLGASLVIGMTATLVQDVVPVAATLAPNARRGKVVGTVMTGMLLGMLLSRAVSGFVVEHFGGRAMFIAAMASIAAIALIARQNLPRFRPTTHLHYGALLRSLHSLWRNHGTLRRAMLAQALLSVGFSAFWSTLAVLLSGAPFHLGSTSAGAFGLVGAAGALAAPLAGRVVDRYSPERVTLIGAALAVVSFGALEFAPLLSTHGQLWLLACSAVGFDLGIQVALIAHQTIVYGVDAGARSRVNAVLVAGMFVGLAIGSGTASLLFAQWGWSAVTSLATLASIAALVVRAWPARRGAR